ncbi:MAG: META domain-containing protein [Pseudomonadota bacterium]
MPRLSLYILSLFLLGQCGPDETISGYAGTGSRWDLVSLGEEAASGTITLEFPKTGRIAGTGPCRPSYVPQAAPYPWIEIRNLDAPPDDCAEITQQQRYLEALSAMTLSEVSGDALILTDETGREMIFQRAPGSP